MLKRLLWKMGLRNQNLFTSVLKVRLRRGRSLQPSSKEKAANIAKGVFYAGKKAYRLANKDKKKTEKKKFKGLGDLL